ncbi:MAG: indole-3-glycerol phosphate synthase TrpC, partial [Myxococcota bacterium]
MNFLDRILDAKRAELERAKRRLPYEALRDLVAAATPARDFAGALTRGDGPRIIAEVKRASPSRGVLRPQQATVDWQPEALALEYARGGAVALSVLTDVHFFWGHPDAIAACRDAVDLPALRKEFVLDPYQVDESRWLGADAVLLIVRALDQETLGICAARTAELGMAVLVEIHADSELPAALGIPNAIIGINHRDLEAQTMDMKRAERLRPQIPDDRLVVAESGLSDAAQVKRLAELGI